MVKDIWTDRLSEYVDGDLTREETEALETHLLECADCGRTLQELRAVVARAAQVVDRPPVTDLWPGIAAQVAEWDPGRVVALRESTSRRRFSVSIPQLAAASIALMLLSGGTMYVMLGGRVEPPLAQAPAQQPRVAATTDELLKQPVPVKSPAAENYHTAIDELEGALETGRSSLDTTTVRVLETNLRAIDTAIAEARQALSRDPGNPYLNRYLDQTMQRKIQLLRRATRILRAET
ncbi:MAG: zf-HC2 domain-containing protein [Gemmatimonadota bacterium]